MQARSWFNIAIAPHLPRYEFDELTRQIQAQAIKPEWWTEENPPAWMVDFLKSFQMPEYRDLSWLREFWISQGFLSEPDPLWATLDLQAAFDAGTAHTFILHLNVRDFVFDARYGFHRLDRYLVNRYDPSLPGRSFLFYNRSKGFTNPEHRLQRKQSGFWENFLNKLGIEPNNLQLMNDPNVALQAIEKTFINDDPDAEQPSKNGVVVFEFAEKVVPSVEIAQQDPNVLRQIETLQRWALSEQFSANRHLIILLTHNVLDISAELRIPTSQVKQIEISFPSTRERLKYISYLYYEAYRNQHIISFDEQDFQVNSHRDVHPAIIQMQMLADRTAGLSRASIREIILRAWNMQSPITNTLIQDLKQAIIKAESQELLDVMEPKANLDSVGGLEDVKAFLRDEVITPLRSGDAFTQRNVPAGVMFLGPPGTGKTIVAEALAMESGLNMVKLGNFRNMFVGQSERNLSLALRIIRSMTPVLVFMDELDQSEGSRGEGNLDSGVSKRIFQQLITFMSDDSLRGQVVWIAASNRPDLIDNAMRREGRFDDKLPFLTPKSDERKMILEAILVYKMRVPPAYLPRLNLGRFADDSVSLNYTGAEMEVVLTRAMRYAIGRGQSQITEADLQWAFDNFMPGRDVVMNRYMTLLALQHLNDRRFVVNLIKDHEDHNSEYKQYFDENGKKLNEILDDAIFELRERLWRRS